MTRFNLRQLVFVALAAPSLAGGADAQVATLPAGTRLRAAVPSLEPGPVVGPLLSRAGDTLTIGHLGESARITLPPGTLAALHERTEGWPAGVYLADWLTDKAVEELKLLVAAQFFDFESGCFPHGASIPQSLEPLP